jgi:hypothetical protein
MSWFRQESDPFSNRSRSLDRQLKTVKEEIEQLSLTLTADASHDASHDASSIPTDAPRRQGVNHGLRRSSLLDLTRGLYSKLAFANRGRVSKENSKLVNYLSVGSFEGVRPLRYERRIARNRILFFAACALIVALGLWSLMT